MLNKINENMKQENQMDSILRRRDTKKIITTLLNNRNSTLNLNGKWGSGKTYLSNIVQNDLNQPQRNMLALRFNLCDYSYVEDPLVPFIITVFDFLNEHNLTENPDYNKLISSLVTVISILSSASLLVDQSGTLRNLFDVAKKLLSNDKSKKMNNNSIELNLANIKAYRKAILELGESICTMCQLLNKERLIIFVDEFDRVNPEYAFKILNIIHQLKETTPQLQVCTIMNRKQFEQQLCHLYGCQDQDEHYLTKYIDLEYTVQNPILDFTDEFFKEFNFPKQFGEYLYLRVWISMLSVREVKIFSTIYREKISEILDGSYDLQQLLTVYKDAAYCAVLLCIVLVKFDLQFKSFNNQLLNAEEQQDLAKSLLTFAGRLNGEKNYIHESYRIDKGALSLIIDRAVYFLVFKLTNKDYSDELKDVSNLLEKVYKEYFYI